MCFTRRAARLLTVTTSCLSPADEEGGFARTNLAKELHFFEKVKAKLRSREAYQDFLKCLNLYAQEVISKSELTHLVHDLIGRFSDLAVRLSLLHNRPARSFLPRL